MSKYTNYILLLVFVDGLGLALSSIEIFNEKNTSLVTFDSYSASFGPSIPDNGFQGYIAVGKPLNGCVPMERPPNISYVDPKQWIALVVRTPSLFGNCSFDLKVYHAQRAGYAAVIIYNSDSDDLIKMSSAGAYSILIPSVFVGHSTGLEISQFYTYMNKTYAVIYNEDDINYLLIPFISVVSICFLIAVCIFLTKLALHCHKIRKNRFPKSELKKIPTKKYTKSDKYDTCPICLNEYEEGVKIRILPCEHAYHVECIDKWLLRNNRLCPVCKRRVIPGGSDSDSDETSSSTGGGGTATMTSADNSRLIGNETSEATSAGEAPATSSSNMLIVAENEPNEDDDTNESSRLLITTTTAAAAAAASARNSDDQPASVSVLNEIISNGGMGAINADISSLNNQMLMTTSIGSGTSASAAAGQLFLQSNNSNNPVITSTNNSIMSKYGSISSINQISSSKNVLASTSATAVSSNPHQYDNLIYQDDDDDELLDVATGDAVVDENNTAEAKGISKQEQRPIGSTSSLSKLSPAPEEYHSPVSIDPLEERIEQGKSTSSSKIVDIDATKVDNVIFKKTKSTNAEKRPNKKQLKKKSASSKAAPLAADISKIAAKLEQENKRQKTQQPQQSKDQTSNSSNKDRDDDEKFLSVEEDENDNDPNSNLV